MLKTLIRYKENTLLLDIPYQRYDIVDHLGSIGIPNPAGDIYIRDRDDENISVKLFSETALGNRLIPLFGEDTALSTVNTVCDVLQGLPQEQMDGINYDLAHGEYDTVTDLLNGVKSLNTSLQTVKFYCPLTFQTEDEDGFEFIDVENDSSYLDTEAICAAVKGSIRDDEPYGLRLYFRESKTAEEKIKSIFPSVEEHGGMLYGVYELKVKEPLSEPEEAAVKSWLIGQAADGHGESLEQRPVETDNGNLYISFWNSGNDYFMMNEHEFNDYIKEQNCGMKWGEM
jgi:hypothetical protein